MLEKSSRMMLKQISNIFNEPCPKNIVLMKNKKSEHFFDIFR